MQQIRLMRKKNGGFERKYRRLNRQMENLRIEIRTLERLHGLSMDPIKRLTMTGDEGLAHGGFAFRQFAFVNGPGREVSAPRAELSP